MPRRTLSFAQRHAKADRDEAIATVTTTERLLALILIELMQARAHRTLGELSTMLRRAGFSKPQIAALLDTTEATISVSEHRLAVPPAPAARREDEQ